jgi:hypothetical protein
LHNHPRFRLFPSLRFEYFLQHVHYFSSSIWVFTSERSKLL